ncbi:MAG TPA: protease modulator HflC [Anaerolineae bacterium]|nr:protease modulator HflC [Anaerolineae bacterium]
MSRYILPALAALAFVVATLVFFSVDTTEYAIVTQFGDPVRALTAPGLYTKLPDPAQSVIRINNRLRLFALPQAEFLTQDKKNVVVESYATWRVADPLLFFKSVRDAPGAEARLADILASDLGVALGTYDLSSLVTIDAASMQLPTMMEQVTANVDNRTAQYGFSVTDVRLKLITYPEANQASVFQRMRAERDRIARQLRSEGAEEAAKIRAVTETEAATIRAEAAREAESTRGKADAEAIRIYAEAYGKDEEFYRFLRTLQSYDKFIDEATTLILPANSELLRFLNPQAITGSAASEGATTTTGGTTATSATNP